MTGRKFSPVTRESLPLEITLLYVECQKIAIFSLPIAIHFVLEMLMFFLFYNPPAMQAFLSVRRIIFYFSSMLC
jgi:hypothetical protein